ncbi:hypothetical protein ACIQI7_32035 [Kitasatospora sp. NPDC092039]|uniref:hypothetical protein n=1 Tax=Kitasatospora sp. NPDC092039 TaxID=3364086 RepID=UPI0037FB7962
MPSNLRRVTHCAESATHSTVRYGRRARRVEWVIYTCEWHSAGLTSSWSFGGRHNLRPLDDGDRQRCGTMLDHRPPLKIIADHFRFWLPCGTPVVDGHVVPWRGWAHRLRAACEDGYLHGGSEVADHLDLALAVAESAPDGDHTPEQLAAVLDALAAAEYCHLRDLARSSQW